MFRKHTKLHLLVFTLFFVANLQTALSADKNVSESAVTEINGVEIKKSQNAIEVIILTKKQAQYKTNIVPGSGTAPARMYIDIENSSLINIQNEYYIGEKVEKVRVAQNDKEVRFVLDSNTDKIFKYDIIASESALIVKVFKTVPLNQEISSNSSDQTLDTLIDSSIAELSQEKEDKNEATDIKEKSDSFASSGFKKNKISVDFYKIDIHNVFRLFREVSGLNIIVDEKVSGNVTLSLNDVPWDFALDIVLNLQGLTKEERHNTIVIYPKEEVFVWPERSSADNLEIESDLNILEQETLIVQQAANKPKEIMLAQEALKAAKKQEKNGNIEDAAILYEKALESWPENTNISDKLSTIYLVELGMNAKAVFHAKNSLVKDKTNYPAALRAAIGSANMQSFSEASDYFSHSISGNPPLKEGLISYAAFSEKRKDYDSAIKLLKKYTEFYPDTMNTILSRARVYDKMGKVKLADLEFANLLSSGYQLRPDLKKYIKNRLQTQN